MKRIALPRRNRARWMLLGVLVLLVAGTARWAVQLQNELDELAQGLDLAPGAQATFLYDRHGEPIFSLYHANRIAVPLDAMSPHLVHAVLAAEDRRFAQHGGIDWVRILGAMRSNLRNRRIVEGGSTITQQLVRLTVLDRSRTFWRKSREALLALRLEKVTRKDQILEAYLNRVFLGHGHYGVEAAARGYFGKSALQLDPAESATLAAMLRGPSLYSPRKAQERVTPRRNWILAAMRDQGWLTSQQYEAAVTTPVEALAHSPVRPDEVDARFFRDAVIQELGKLFGKDRTYEGGLRVTTTLDPEIQRQAEATVAAELAKLHRQSDIDSSLQCSLVALDPNSGNVLALVGGQDYDESCFNRAVDAMRQPGSAFKPIVFAAALEDGFDASTRLEGLDQEIRSLEGPWLPEDKRPMTAMTLRQALVRSSNRGAAHLQKAVGARRSIELARKLGIHQELFAVPSLVLGTAEVTLLEMTASYLPYATGGIRRPPRLIEWVEDSLGNVLYEAPQEEERVLSESTGYLVASMLADALNHGTGPEPGRADFAGPREARPEPARTTPTSGSWASIPNW